MITVKLSAQDTPTNNTDPTKNTDPTTVQPDTPQTNTQATFSPDAHLIPNIVENSPSSAAIGRFGTYKVNTFTGLPDISIPLYEVKSGDITIPIVLSYHASGIKVTDAASWVGLGWALNAGGSINSDQKRQVQDLQIIIQL